MKRRLIIILVIGAMALLWASIDGPAARQRRSMNAARAFSEELTPKLRSDSRFATIKTGVSTHPGLIVLGEVPDEKALEDLKAIVTPPPDAKYRLLFYVKIIPADAEPASSQNLELHNK